MELTSRQQQVLRLLASGKSAKEISAELGVSLSTTYEHIQHLKQRLGAHTDVEIVVLAVIHKLL